MSQSVTVTIPYASGCSTGGGEGLDLTTLALLGGGLAAVVVVAAFASRGGGREE